MYNSSISYGSFINLKFLYISRLTEKDTEICLCSKCLNPCCSHKAIKSTVDSNLPNSLYEYLCKSTKCHKEPETDFCSREGILGQCGNNCKITNTGNDLKNDLVVIRSKIIYYYTFETVQTITCLNSFKGGFNKSGFIHSYCSCR